MNMKGRVIQFRRGRRTITEKHFLIEVDGTDNMEKADKLVGKSVEWTSPAGKIIKGKIASHHGNKGVIRAIFEKGLPGQAIGTPVEIK
ncbi:MAG: 50S ribosomal protein L35ae [archaeon]|nr:50S ribosomal protein L35ae [archaeon]